jgi:hypothetical protein
VLSKGQSAGRTRFKVTSILLRERCLVALEGTKRVAEGCFPEWPYSWTRSHQPRVGGVARQRRLTSQRRHLVWISLTSTSRSSSSCLDFTQIPGWASDLPTGCFASCSLDPGVSWSVCWKGPGQMGFAAPEPFVRRRRRRRRRGRNRPRVGDVVPHRPPVCRGWSNNILEGPCACWMVGPQGQRSFGANSHGSR